MIGLIFRKGWEIGEDAGIILFVSSFREIWIIEFFIDKSAIWVVVFEGDLTYYLFLTAALLWELEEGVSIFDDLWVDLGEGSKWEFGLILFNFFGDNRVGWT